MYNVELTGEVQFLLDHGAGKKQKGQLLRAALVNNRCRKTSCYINDWIPLLPSSRSTPAIFTNSRTTITPGLTRGILSPALTGSRGCTITIYTVYCAVKIIIQTVIANLLTDDRAISRTSILILFRITGSVTANWCRTVYCAVCIVFFPLTDAISATIG